MQSTPSKGFDSSLSIPLSWTRIFYIWKHFIHHSLDFHLQVTTPRMDMTLAELQEMASRQQQQIEAQQQMLANKVYLK